MHPSLNLCVCDHCMSHLRELFSLGLYRKISRPQIISKKADPMFSVILLWISFRFLYDSHCQAHSLVWKFWKTDYGYRRTVPAFSSVPGKMLGTQDAGVPLVIAY